MWKGKAIDVSGSSLLGLKAELLAKQLEAQQHAADPSARARENERRAEAQRARSKNRGVEERSRKDRVDAAPARSGDDDAALERSRQRLVEKAAAYDRQMQEARQRSTDDAYTDAGDEGPLVDFDRKAWSEPAAPRPGAGAQDDGGPLVEFVDEFGRSRRVRASELAALTPAESGAAGDFLRGVRPGDLSADLEREWQQLALENGLSLGPAEPVHYQSEKREEVRDLGVGYFAFSKDEQERSTQMQLLERLRAETLAKRAQHEQRRRKRDEALRRRLENIRQRKGLPQALVDKVLSAHAGARGAEERAADTESASEEEGEAEDANEREARDASDRSSGDGGDIDMDAVEQLIAFYKTTAAP